MTCGISHHLEDTPVVRGISGRIVLEVDRDLKRQLYAALAREGLTLKDWFVDAARAYLRERSQPSLPLVAEPRPSPYGSRHGEA